MAQFPPITASEATLSAYELTGARLARRMSLACGSVDWSDVVAQFLVSGGSWSQRTFRLYKAALQHHLTINGAPPSLIKTLRDASSKDCAKRSKATSGGKSKKVSGSDRLLMLSALRARGTDSALLAADYFEAGLVVGPRPVEWVGASLVILGESRSLDAPASGTHQLTLPNAKHDSSGVRGNGPTRTVYLTLATHEAAVIARVIANANSHSGDWDQHYARLRSALRYTGLQLWPRRNKIPCFYTTRHQSQADAKASGRRPNEIAAMFGHASDNTSTQHYARSSQGDKNMYKLAPSAVSLSKVRNQKATQRILDRAKTHTKSPSTNKGNE